MTRQRDFDLWTDCDGVAAIEFCLTLPLLLLMTLGAFDVANLVSRRIDFQQAGVEAIGLALAQPPQGNANLDYLRNAAAAAAKVPRQNVTVARQVRCNNVVTTAPNCSSPSQFALYLNITITGSYVPAWSYFAIDRGVRMSFSRTVRIR